MVSNTAKANMLRRRSTPSPHCANLEDDLGIRLVRNVRPPGELAPQLAIVADLAVEDDPIATVRAGHRLMAAGVIDIERRRWTRPTLSSVESQRL